MKELRGILIGLVVVVISPIWIVALLIFKIFEKPSVLKPAEVEEWLQKMSRGEIDEYWWDDFLNVPIMDPRLDAIRKRYEEIWTPNSGFLTKKSEMDYVPNTDGKREIERLIEECRSIEEAGQPNHA